MKPQDGVSSILISSTQFQQLPPEALARVLGAVPQQQRLASCALVCRAWRDAALAATTQLELQLCRDQPQRSAQVSAWLARHGSGLHSLSVTGGISLELPWSSLGQLRSLRLDQVESSCSTTTSTAATAGQPGPGSVQQMAQLTSLTSLVLDGCTVTSGVLDLYQQQLPALRQLQELEMEWKCWHQGWTADGLGAALAAALSRLTALTRLHAVVTPDGAAAVISSLSSLAQLQRLELQGANRPGHLAETSLIISCSDVPASVTALELSGFIDWQLQAASGAGCPLTALQQLTIRPQFMGLAALSSLPQLRHLHTITWFGADAVAGTRALLAFIAQQQQLQSLSLDGTSQLPADQAQHFAALAASSQLTTLSLTVGEETPAPAVLSAILGPGRRLPLLQQLKLWTYRVHGRHAITWGLAPRDVSRLLQACPGLRELTFLPAWDDDTAAEPAAGVTWSDLAGAAAAQLTKLAVGSDDVNAAFISQFLAQLMGLQDLQVVMSSNITWAALVPLTRLTGLTRLRAWSCGCHEDGLEFLFTSEAGPGQPPDVAQQLRAMCWSAAPAAFLSDQVEQQQAQIADLEAQLAEE